MKCNYDPTLNGYFVLYILTFEDLIFDSPMEIQMKNSIEFTRLDNGDVVAVIRSKHQEPTVTHIKKLKTQINVLSWFEMFAGHPGISGYTQLTENCWVSKNPDIKESVLIPKEMKNIDIVKDVMIEMLLGPIFGVFANSPLFEASEEETETLQDHFGKEESDVRTITLNCPSPKVGTYHSRTRKIGP